MPNYTTTRLPVNEWQQVSSSDESKFEILSSNSCQLLYDGGMEKGKTVTDYGHMQIVASATFQIGGIMNKEKCHQI